MAETTVKLTCERCASSVYLPPSRAAESDRTCPYCRRGSLQLEMRSLPGGERRSHERKRVLRGSITWQTGEGAARCGVLQDVSPGGCAYCVRASDPIDLRPRVGDTSDFLIDVAGEPPVRVLAEVRRVVPAPPPHRYRVGLAFFHDGFFAMTAAGAEGLGRLNG